MVGFFNADDGLVEEDVLTNSHPGVVIELDIRVKEFFGKAFDV